MNRRQAFTIATGGLLTFAVRKPRAQTIPNMPSLEFAKQATTALASGMREYRVTAKQQANFVIAHRIVLAELDQLHGFDRMDAFVRSPSTKAAMLLPPTAEVNAEVAQQAAAVGLPAPLLRAVTENEYTTVARFGVARAQHWLLDTFEQHVGPLLPVVFHESNRPRILRVQSPNPTQSCATLVAQINAFSNTLWIVSGAWFAGGLLTAETCVPCNIVGTISGTLAGTLALAANLTQFYGGC